MTKVHEVSAEVQAMLEASAPIRDVVKGGEHMRKLRTRYLPKFAMENDEDYSARVSSTWLFNGVKKARDDMAGRIFEKPVVLEKQEGQLFEWCQNVDLEGRDLSNFADDAFKAAIEAGISFIMVDAPPRPGGVTRGQAQAMNLRPYMVQLPITSVLGWKWENIANAPVLTQFRIMEQVAKPDRGEFSDETIEQVRALFLEEGRVVVRLYQKRDKSDNEFIQVDEYATDMDQIQVVPVYTGRTAFMRAEPPLADIAELNLAHWRVQSDKSNCLHKALSPLLLLKGIDVDGGAVVNSAGYAFHSNNETAALEWAEITGSGIEKGSEELRDLEKQMQWMGLQLIMSRTGVSTATGDAIDENKSTSRLRSWADNLKDALEIALGWMADMGAISDAETSVVVHKDFSVMGHLTFSDVRDMYNSGAISREAYVAEAMRRGILAENFDADDDAELIEQDTTGLE